MNKDCSCCKFHEYTDKFEAMVNMRSVHFCNHGSWFVHDYISGKDYRDGGSDCYDERKKSSFFNSDKNRCGVSGKFWESK